MKRSLGVVTDPVGAVNIAGAVSAEEIVGFPPYGLSASWLMM